MRFHVGGKLAASIAVATLVAAATAGGAQASGRNFVSDGSFESPVVSSLYDNVLPGQSFEGWTVSQAVVSLGRAIPGLVTAYTGTQFVSLVDAGATTPQTPGTLCKVVKGLVPGHTYRGEVHLASMYQPTTYNLQFGATGAAVPIAASQPGHISWTTIAASQGIATTSVRVCVGADISTTGVAFPLVDAVSVRDVTAG